MMSVELSLRKDGGSRYLDHCLLDIFREVLLLEEGVLERPQQLLQLLRSVLPKDERRVLCVSMKRLPVESASILPVATVRELEEVSGGVRRGTLVGGNTRVMRSIVSVEM
jgi:hypothetical protein